MIVRYGYIMIRSVEDNTVTRDLVNLWKESIVGRHARLMNNQQDLFTLLIMAFHIIENKQHIIVRLHIYIS